MIFVVASMTNRTMPVNVFRMKPAHMYGYIFRTSAKGTSRAHPRIRKAIRPLIPATTPIPSVWRNRTPGYARSEFDSRTHTEKPLCSIAARNCIIRKRPLFAERRHYTGIEDRAECQNEKLRHLGSKYSPPRRGGESSGENSVRTGVIECMLAAIKEFQTVPQGK